CCCLAAYCFPSIWQTTLSGFITHATLCDGMRKAAWPPPSRIVPSGCSSAVRSPGADGSSTPPSVPDPSSDPACGESSEGSVPFVDPDSAASITCGCSLSGAPEQAPRDRASSSIGNTRRGRRGNGTRASWRGQGNPKRVTSEGVCGKRSCE